MSLYLDLVERILLDDIYRPFDTRQSTFQPYAYSMIGRPRMKDLRKACEEVIVANVPGCFVETGICRGGALMMMAAVNEVMLAGRDVYGFDSFNGVPRPYHPVDEGLNLFTFPELAVTKATVEANFRNMELWSERIHLVEGWFNQTLAVTDTGPIAVLRLDGDLYSSTLEALEALYPRLSPGGYILIDDMGDIPQCAQAVHEYRAKHGITAEIHESDWSGRWWVK